MTSRVEATQNFDNQRGEIQARISTQNTFQHHDSQNINWVQWRNELRFDLKYDLIQPGEEVAGLRLLKFNMLYRGRVDPVFKLRQSYKDRNYDRGDFELPEGRYPRELFLDMGFGGALKPLSVRIGRQQVVWGESDLFRSIDVVNPLRIDQNGFVGEDFADIREPLWIAKALWDIGNVGPYLSEAGLEMFYSPNARPQADRPWLQYGETWKLHITQHNVLDGFDRNLVLPFSQVRAPWEFGRVGARYRDSPAVVQNADGSFSDFAYQINNNTPSREIDVKDASMVGVRMLGSTIGNLYFTLNYLFKRSDAAGSSVVFEDIFDPTQPGTGALQPAVLNEAINAALSADDNGNGIPDGQEQQMRDCFNRVKPEVILDPRAVNPGFTGPWHGSIYSDPSNPRLATGKDNISYRPVLAPAGDGLVHSTGCLTIPVWHPWTHIIGLTATYNDYDYTGFVWRLEQSYSTKEPRNGEAPNSPARLVEEARGGQLAVPQERDFATHNMRLTQVWRSMVGFDYLKSLAPESGRKMPQPLRSLLTDQWFFTFQYLNEYDSHADHTNLQTSFTNHTHHWQPLLTLSGTGFFLHQTFRPTWAMGWDLSAKPFPLFLVQGEYFLTPMLVVRMGEILYAGSKNNETDSGLHFYADRDTFFIRMTYFLA